MFSATVLHISAGTITCAFRALDRSEVSGLQSFLSNRVYMIFKIYFIDFVIIWSISIVQARILCCLFTEQIWFDTGDAQSVLNSGCCVNMRGEACMGVEGEECNGLERTNEFLQTLFL
jgi:hypothetical protein